MQERDERIDTLELELKIIIFFWNIEITCWLENPSIPFDHINWQITEEELADELAVGKRTVERVCARLDDLGRLRRLQANSRDTYAYHVSQETISLITAELMLRGTPMIRQDEHGRILEFGLIPPGNKKKARLALDEFFDMHE